MSANHSLKIVTKLNRETKEGKIVWDTNRTRPSSLSGSDELLDIVYITKVLEKQFRLYKYQHKSYYDENLYEWVEDYRLEFIDPYGKSEWTFPNDSSIVDLYDSVRFKTSNIDKFMEDYLNEEDLNDEPNDFF